MVGRATPAKRPLDSSGESLADKNGEGGATSGFTVKRMRIISESESENGSPNKVSQVGVKFFCCCQLLPDTTYICHAVDEKLRKPQKFSDIFFFMNIIGLQLVEIARLFGTFPNKTLVLVL